MLHYLDDYRKRVSRPSVDPMKGQWLDSVPLMVAFAASLARVWIAVLRNELARPGPCLALLACLVTGGLLVEDLRSWVRRRSAGRGEGSVAIRSEQGAARHSRHG